MRPTQRIYQSTPAWLRPLFSVTEFILALAVVGALISLILGKKIDAGLIVAGGAAAGIGALAFGISREFFFRTEAIKVWVTWPLAFGIGAAAFLPITNVTLGRAPFELVPPLSWLLVYFTTPILIGFGFSWSEWRSLQEAGRSSWPDRRF
jgi:hypothetical protein